MNLSCALVVKLLAAACLLIASAQLQAAETGRQIPLNMHISRHRSINQEHSQTITLFIATDDEVLY